MHKSNKWDAAKDVLLVSQRLEKLSDSERKTREYRKRNRTYWHDEIKVKRAAKRLSLKACPANVIEPCTEPGEVDVDSMTVSEIKDHLKRLGVSTHFRKIDKLRKQLKHALDQ